MMEATMKKPLLVLFRAILLLVFIIVMMEVLSYASAVKNQTFNIIAYFLPLAFSSILFGAVLRSDFLFTGKRSFKIDWLSLLLIGLPSLVFTFTYPLMFYVFPKLQLPGFVSEFLFWDKLPLVCGVLFGYTIVNSLFQEKKE
jgi:hypothetical protein